MSAVDLRERVRPVILGTGNLGGIAGEVGPGIGLNPEQSEAVLDRAADEGIGVLDSADMYARGASERIVGQWLRSHPEADLLVQTKTGYTPEGPDLSPERLARQLRHSIDTLGRVDLYLTHRVDPRTPWEKSLPVLGGAVEDGTIRAYGVSNVTAEDLVEVLAVADRLGIARPTLVQNSFSLLVRGDEAELLPVVEAEGLLYTPYSPLAQGLLTGRYSHGESPSHGSRASVASRSAALLAAPRTLERLRAFDDLAARHGWSPAALALAWVIHHPQVAAPIISVSRPSQWDGLSVARGITWTPELADAVGEIFPADEAPAA